MSKDEIMELIGQLPIKELKAFVELQTKPLETDTLTCIPCNFTLDGKLAYVFTKAVEENTIAGMHYFYAPVAVQKCNKDTILLHKGMKFGEETLSTVRMLDGNLYIIFEGKKLL